MIEFKPGTFVFFNWNRIHIIIMIIILFIAFMLGIYNYILGTNKFLGAYSVAAVLYLRFVLDIMLYSPWNVFCACTSTIALSAVLMQCAIWLFFLQFRNFLLSRYVVQVSSEWFWKGSIRPCYYRNHFAFNFHMRWYSVMGYSYLKTFSASYFIIFLSPEIAASINPLAYTDVPETAGLARSINP